MKSNHSITSNLSWSSSLDELYPKGLTKTAQKVSDAGIKSLSDLLWTFPLRVQLLPIVRSFESVKESYIFRGRGNVISSRVLPNFKARGKSGATLLNITLIVQDYYSSKQVSLKWFNAYSSVARKVEKLKNIEFVGTVQVFQDQYQIITPEIIELSSSDISQVLSDFDILSTSLKVQYPTVNTVSTSNLKKIFNKIPNQLWSQLKETISKEILNKRGLISLIESFHIMHGKEYKGVSWSEELQEQATQRLIYEELFQEQLKIYSRKSNNYKKNANVVSVSEQDVSDIIQIFPYQLTIDQLKVIDEIKVDLYSGYPMMRLVQGDVGCGKTVIAISSALLAISNKKQAALMCPTEALALQHYIEIKELLKYSEISVSLLLGSTQPKEKKRINLALENGEIDFIIGTHSLIQDSLKFKQLAIAIIDEQHKFGVEQRLKLISKGKGSHCLIMTATPIPRSLSLTQYGDLDISTIKMMPQGRKGHKTKIVTPENFSNFLNFVSTRLSMNEQVYIVVPAINESETQDFLHLTQVLEKFKEIFPEYRVCGLHGQLKADEKTMAFRDFKSHNIDVLIATSVVEVGINVPNATVMAILNPERFGLSSLHQLRGRVGRGSKPGFCFLVNDKKISLESMKRLKVIEENNDGFSIAEEDLKIRGEGDIFGKNQSGSITTKKLANIIIHQRQLLEAKEDLDILIHQKDEIIFEKIQEYSDNMSISATV